MPWLLVVSFYVVLHSVLATVPERTEKGKPLRAVLTGVAQTDPLSELKTERRRQEKEAAHVKNRQQHWPGRYRCREAGQRLCRQLTTVHPETYTRRRSQPRWRRTVCCWCPWWWIWSILKQCRVVGYVHGTSLVPSNKADCNWYYSRFKITLLYHQRN